MKVGLTPPFYVKPKLLIMKKLKELKLTSLVKSELKKQKMELLLGGAGCACGCIDEGSLAGTRDSYTYYTSEVPYCCMCACDSGMYQATHNVADDSCH